MLTTRLSITAVIGAHVAVITDKRRTRLTLHGDTPLFSGADVAIRAVAVLIALTARDRIMDTAAPRVAGIIGAPVAVVTADGRSSLTCPVRTLIP